MNRRSFLMMSTTFAASLGFLQSAGSELAAASPQGLPTSAGAERTKLIVAAAAALLSTLDGDQPAAVQRPVVPQAKATAAHFKGGQRGDVVFTGEEYSHSMWSNFPVSDVPRPGVRLGNLTAEQRKAAMALIGVLLSDRGYQKVIEIMGSDQALADSGVSYAAGRDAYTLAIFGTPSVESLWMVQFGGHHLAINVTIRGEHAVLAPVLTGCMPAIYLGAGNRVRALAAENDKAFDLLATLDDDQRKQATIDHSVCELVLGPGHDGDTIAFAGAQAANFSPKQQDMLFELICEWACILNDIHAAPRLMEIREGLADTYFAWSGPVIRQPDHNGASYFRIHGPKLFIEFSPQSVGGDPTMHVHTIYRDPPNAYGRALSV
jgi:hypothetical protein